jgi:hypothetical protein
MEVVIEAGAGASAGYPDADFIAKGACVAADRAEVFRTADVIAQVLCYGANDKTGQADVPLLRLRLHPIRKYVQGHEPSFSDVLFGAFGQEQASAAAGAKTRAVRSASAEEAAGILGAANKVVIVPGYGMAVSQAQHKVRELYDALTKRASTCASEFTP